MIRFTRILPALLVSASVLVAAAPGEAHALPCGSSAATIAADTWDAFHDEAVILGCTYFTVFGIDYSNCYAVAQYADLLPRMVEWWNDMANNNWAVIGPRELQWSGIMNGNLVGGTSRLFCSAAPSDKETVEITITKLDGKAAADVEICKLPESGPAVTTHSFSFVNGDDNIGVAKTRTVTGAKGDVICVNINSNNLVNTFQYSLDADK